MDRNDLVWIKSTLETQRERILSTAKIDIREGAEERREILDEADLATFSEEQDSRCNRYERNLALFWRIEQALWKIEQGTFGFCEECDERIDIERLKAHPTATFCIDCKQDQEDSERRAALRGNVLNKNLFLERN